MNSGKQVTYTTYYGAMAIIGAVLLAFGICLLYTSPSPRD